VSNQGSIIAKPPSYGADGAGAGTGLADSVLLIDGSKPDNGALSLLHPAMSVNAIASVSKIEIAFFMVDTSLLFF